MDRVEAKVALILLILLAFVAGVLVTYSWAEPATKVIGECEIKKDTELFSVYLYSSGWYPSVVKAFKDQKVYITEKDDNTQTYIGDGYGFSNNCPIHGEEILRRKGKIEIPYNTPDLKCRMF